MSAFLSALRAQWRGIFADPGALLVLGGAVIVYAFFYPIPYLRQVLREVPLVVVDDDHSALSRRLVRLAEASPLLRVSERAESEAAAQAQLRAGRAGGALVIPAGFERGVLRGERVTVGAYADGAYFLVYRQAMTGLVQSVGMLSAGVEVRRWRAAGRMGPAALADREPLKLRIDTLYNTPGGYATYVVPAVLLLILQQTLLIGIGMLAGTRRAGGAAPGPPPATGLWPLLGRATAFLILYTLHATFYFVVVYRIYGFPGRGAPGPAVLFLLPFLLAVIFLGFALSTLFTRRETAMQALLFTSLPALFLSGFSWPPEAIPAGLRAAATLLPSTSGIRGFLRLNQMGASLAEVRGEWLTLWALAALYLAAAWILERRAAATALQSRVL